MITASTEIPIGEVLLDWARAEPDRITARTPELAALALHAATGATLSMTETGLIVGGLLGARGIFVGHFISYPTRWSSATCTLADIGALNLCTWFERYPDLPGRPNLRTVAELARRRPDHWHKDPFAKTKMRGRPILVSDTIDGPWCVLEGTHRLAEIFRLTEAGTPPFETVEVILGVCPEARSWYSWRPR